MTKSQGGAKIFTQHPDTGTIFDNFKIPYFEELKRLTKNAAILLPDKLIGGDIGISDKGPVLIEGNGYYGIDVSDLAYGGYRKHPVFKKILAAIQ